MAIVYIARWTLQQTCADREPRHVHLQHGWMISWPKEHLLEGQVEEFTSGMTPEFRVKFADQKEKRIRLAVGLTMHLE